MDLRNEIQEMGALHASRLSGISVPTISKFLRGKKVSGRVLLILEETIMNKEQRLEEALDFISSKLQEMMQQCKEMKQICESMTEEENDI